ncbi:GGDEF domain-containing protein [Desulfatitalea alkaliphila]|uniref:diguanylate cyclase n=1 Tax=Desulfatitalea alkaliphila TaxID=2929485 RepID=A0AA41R7X8_9BACT|nr:GGDEF domain-containing protein [Desulfatitalea alkaliphila]MCJ8500618.1 diguanylate cyclase [Desulfatitalea alkaliphila]
MGWFSRNNGSTEDTDLQLAAEQSALLEERSAMLLRTVNVLLHLLQAFALDIKEIHADRFKEELQALNERLQSAEKPKRLEVHFEHQKERMLAFIDRQRGYLEDREKELRDIIDLLTRAMANLNVENREFYERIYDQSDKLIALNDLDDIKKLKSALQAEVDQMRDMVHIKQDQEQRQIQLLAGQVQTLQNELHKAREKSMTDPLTGIYNRQALDDVLAERIMRSRIVESDFCLLMIDVDDFKQINDRYGHIIGDRVLIAMAQKLRNAIRGDDLLARYGGEEFTIILEGAILRHAQKKARQICDTIASVRYATSETQTDNYLTLTVSIGVTAYRNGDTAEDLIGRADQALYQAKHKGKNCVVAKKS